MLKLLVAWSATAALAGCLQAGQHESELTLDLQDCGNSPQVVCYPDDDGDLQGDATRGVLLCSCPAGMVTNNLDCNDSDATIKHRTCYTDADGDGHGEAGSSPIDVCAASCGQGRSTDDTDCIDNDATTVGGVDCYPDADGDHYGHGPAVTLCSCPPGYSATGGDCDDTNSSIHPYRLEVAGNGIDDDCSLVADDARSIFYETGNGNTDTSFAITVTLNNTAEINAATGTGLNAKIWYRKLEDANDSDNYSVSAIKTMSISTTGGVTTATVTLTGLEQMKVYEARLSFFNRFGIPIHPTDGGSYNSDPYYTMTKPSGTDTPVKTARYNIVLEALYQYYYFRTHSMGSWDRSLRNHFGLDDNDSAWCSEFYATSTYGFLHDMNPCNSSDLSWCVDSGDPPPAPLNPPESSTGALHTYFDTHNIAVIDAVESDVAASKPGDWLGVHPNSTHQYGQHTQMLLAYNATDHLYWFVEGNGSEELNKDTWGTRVHTANVGFHGITQKDWPATIGRLDNPSMIGP